MIHEFGHKSLYRGNYLEDNLPTRSFSLGRHLLDSASHALAVYAAEKNLIGRYFTLLDHFACNIQVGQTTFGTIGSTQRLFFGDFDHFDTGIGNRPTDFQIFLTESPGVKLFLRINIQERSACNSEDKNGRQTELKIVRMHEHSANVTDQAEIIKSILLPGQNPVCEKTPSLLVIEADSLRFECQYLGASGVFK
jgi:hypothetical protein